MVSVDSATENFYHELASILSGRSISNISIRIGVKGSPREHTPFLGLTATDKRRLSFQCLAHDVAVQLLQEAEW
jgi:hypothetical protein